MQILFSNNDLLDIIHAMKNRPPSTSPAAMESER